MEFIVEEARKEDLDEIFILQKVCYISEAEAHGEFDIPPLTESIDATIQDFEKGLILIVEVDDEIIASVRAYEEDNTCYIGKLIVRPDFQNRGIGKLLIKEIEGWFDFCSRYELFTGYKSEKNLYLYNELGYKEFKREKINKKLTLVYFEKNND